MNGGLQCSEESKEVENCRGILLIVIGGSNDILLFKLMDNGVTGEVGVLVIPKQGKEKEVDCATTRHP